MDFRTEVLIVGGGATGVGISRDLALRGVPSLLIERKDFLSGASGRNHGLLHSGGRYAVSDPEAARECMNENRVLRRIAPHCVDDTGGLFISLPEDDLHYQERFLRACAGADIPAALLSRDEALDLEPELNPGILGAVKVPDGSMDPFQIVLENVRDAENHGAKFLPHAEIRSFTLEGAAVKEVSAVDRISGETHSIRASFVINAAGAWANHLLGLAGLHIGLTLSKGTLLVANRRLSGRVINRCHPPSNGDIVVPNQTVSILGTTSVRSEDADHFDVTPQEVFLLIEETSKMIPEIKEARFIRAYAGIRPLFQADARGDDRAISRGFALIDHEERDGVKNLITVTGGKFVTYRLMAERASDLVCRKMGLQVPCSTHSVPLPAAPDGDASKDHPGRPAKPISAIGEEMLCDCELVRREEVERLLKDGRLKDFQDLLRRTRVAKGTCQGSFCVYRLLGVLHQMKTVKGDSIPLLKDFLEERWKGIRPVLWGASLKEEELVESIYKGIFNL